MTSFIVRAATDMAFSDLTALASAAPARAEVALTSPAPAVTHYRLAEINGIEMFYVTGAKPRAFRATCSGG